MGMNTPEADECFYEEAVERSRALLGGATVGLDEIGTDQFDRMLAYLWIGEQMVNRTLVEEGFALATTPEPGDADGEAIIGSEAEAAGAGAGLWGLEVCGSSGPVPVVSVVLAASHTDPPGPDEADLAAETILFDFEESVDVSEWTVRDESSAHRCRLPGGAEAGPGSPLEVSSADPCWQPGGSPVWNNGGDLVLLLDEHGRVVTHARYRD